VKIHSAPKPKPQDYEIVPWFITGLLKFELITQEQADAAYAEWDRVSWDEIEEDRKWRVMMARMAWKNLPLKKRLFKSRFWWEMDWVRESRDW
jgi:hypothetical protein